MDPGTKTNDNNGKTGEIQWESRVELIIINSSKPTTVDFLVLTNVPWLHKMLL